MKSSINKEIDYAAVAQLWFGLASASGNLRSVILAIARQAHDSAEYGSLAQRKDKLYRAERAAAKLQKRLAELDPTTRIRAFGGRGFSEPDDGSALLVNAAPAENADALSELMTFETLLCSFVAKLESLGKNIPPQEAGALPLPDAVVFGVGCLMSFWKKYRSDIPTSGQNRDSFGLLAEQLLCAPPVNATKQHVQTALRYHFQRERVESNS